LCFYFELLQKILSDPDNFSFLPNTNQSITIDKNTELRLNASSLNAIDDSEVNLQWTSTFSSIEMELLKLPNYSSGKYLKPIYTFQVNASQGQQEINVNNQSPIEVRIEGKMHENASLFYLSNEGWGNVGSQSLQFNEWTDINGNLNEGYFAQINQNGWYSISTEEILTSETFSTFCIELPGQYTQGNTKSFVILANDVVVPLTRVMEQGTFCSTIEVPENQPFRLIVMSSLRKGYYELFYSEQQMENGLIVAPTMEEKSIDQIKSILQDI